MQDVSAVVNALVQEYAQRNNATADSKQVAEFERLMNSMQPGQATVDQYVAPPESPMEIASSKVFRIGSEASTAFRNEIKHFDDHLEALDVTSPTAMQDITRLQMQAYGTLYQVEIATSLASQANRGFQTLFHIQN